MQNQDWKDLYPFESRFFDLHDGTVRMHYVDEGKGDPVLMLHGNPTWSFFYRNLIIGLKGKYRCIAPDHVGCGLSSKPRDYSYTLAQHIENVLQLVEALKLQKLTLVLHDWGGAIGMGLAQRKPDLIKRIVLFNTAAFLSERIPQRIGLCKIPVFGDIAIRGLNAFAAGAIWMAVHHHDRMTRKVRAGFLAPYNSWANRIATLRFVQDIPMKEEHPTWGLMQIIETSLPNFRDRPILICWGMKDFCFDEDFLARWIKEFPMAEVHRVEDAGHYLLEDAHERIVPLVQYFLGFHRI